MIVVDASILVTALGDDGSDGDRARSRLEGERLAAPHLIDLEVTSAWRRLAASGDLDPRRAQFALDDLRALRIQRPHGSTGAGAGDNLTSTTRLAGQMGASSHRRRTTGRSVGPEMRDRAAHLT
ncbi:MAG: type II toxin-antitoxin system VapC family toxin [Actinomycetota bacterium]|nr:MAG: type II toxin-antitoxin system VapC family toxin [Actinomycetota bacterium]